MARNGINTDNNHINKGGHKEEYFHGGIEYFPKDEAHKLENHILAESFHYGYLDKDKIDKQVDELNSLNDQKSK